jgi:hypothetical protein
VREIQALLSSLGREEEFPIYVADLRARHHRKRNLVKLIDELSQSVDRERRGRRARVQRSSGLPLRARSERVERPSSSCSFWANSKARRGRREATS